MANDPILIKRYPNRRYYARNTSKYVSLKEIDRADGPEWRDGRNSRQSDRG